MNLEQFVEWGFARETEVLRKSLPHCPVCGFKLFVNE
jgi:hypothetical protein